MPNFASREWLLSHLEEMKREAARLKASQRLEVTRTKPWPRKRGLTTASGAPALFRQ